jgi:hypothetical protein
MYIEYSDLLSRIAEPPIWWMYGVPRYEPFTPQDMGVHEYEVALVHTECQQCQTRYDVGVRAGRYARTLRNLIAYENQLDIGDPPNACRYLGINCGSGATMGSLQVAVLEYWVKDWVEEGKRIPKWRRDGIVERPLIDWNWHGDKAETPAPPASLQIHNSPQKGDWMRAREEGDLDAMAGLLAAFGCERPKEVAHMLDLERRQRAFSTQVIELDKARFGSRGMPLSNS